jgi:hypothetical protein
MSFATRLADWNAASDTFERHRDAGLVDPSGRRLVS